ncbi:hypothetical protein [Parapedobacter koreensis]|uniref:Tryptophan-rich sensory protein n=1 Tax=Parapedobacter koreensis TaxID=332977 RepID=A0A1H7GMY0_9SPHI|nr:hypothetical protein [Parapedobacter koreensis]SEK39434.1 hypothetical protein SAMN05421740_101742 [Parapedobacter koreensis]
MDSAKGLKWISKRKQQWLAYQLTAKLCYAIAATFAVAAVLFCFMQTPLWIYPVICSVLFSAMVHFSGIAKVQHHQIADMLDIRFPQLEHSASLFLKSSESLGMLQKLQIHRLYQSAFDLPVGHFINYRILYKPVGILLLTATAYFIVLYNVTPHLGNGQVSSLQQTANTPKPSMDLPAAIAAAQVRITPPVYTGLPKSKQTDLSIAAPLGSTIGLNLTTTARIREMALLLDGKTTIRLHPHDKDSLRWDIEFKPQKNGFYQLSLDGELSALYPLELIPDLPVTIRVSNPDQHTVIDFGFPETVALNASMQDDYAIREAQIMATISSGKGEGVSFKSHEIPLRTAVKNKKDATIAQTIDLKKLGMGPGDELYFYMKANDNAGQESRSDVFVVVLQDTAELFSMSGMVSGVDLAPEYFRSQRQIIIDTEKLLAEMDSLSTPEVHNRSNNLGIDQQLLRLRYGQFLGEEAEDAIGGHVGHDHGEQGPQSLAHLPKEEVVSHNKVRDWKNHDPGHEGHENHANEFKGEGPTEVPINMESLIAEMSHQHDRAEDATFFDAEQKAHLKATLTEMWNTELRLRTYKPREALPYAYKALRMLKELQQKSRVYVGKAPTKTTPLNPEKRLAGDLEEITGAEQHYTTLENPDELNVQQRLKRTLAYLSNLKTTRKLDEMGRQLLIEAERSVMEAASREPAQYLSALKAIRLLEEDGGENTQAEIQLIEKAIHELLPTLTQQPQKKNHVSKQPIYQLYFKQLTVN